MYKIEFQSKAEQVITILNEATLRSEFDKELITYLFVPLSDAIVKGFSFQDYLELDGYLSEGNEVPDLNLLFDVIGARVSEIKKLFDREIIKAKMSLNEGDCILFLLNRKRETLAFNPNSATVKALLEYYLLEIHLSIIRNKSVLANYLKQGIRNDSDAMNLFLVYPKVEALKRYERYIFSQVAKDGIETVAQNLHVKMGRAQDLIGQSHIPRIDHFNYMKEDLFDNRDAEHVSFDEIDAILIDRDYFKETLPLSNLEDKDFINLDEDFIEKESAVLLLEEFFREKYGLVSDQYGNKIIHVFLSSITGGNHTYSFRKHELFEAQSLISKHAKEPADFLNLVGILWVMGDQKIIKNTTSKLPNILKHYVTPHALDEKTIKGYFLRRRGNMSLFKDAMYNWFDSKAHLLSGN